MLDRLINLFSSSEPVPTPEPLPEPDEKLALGALMIRVAKSDDLYLLSEIQKVDAILGNLNNCGPVEAAKIRALCEKLEKEAPDTNRFGEIICASVSYEQRLQALTALWRVVFADGMQLTAEVHSVEAARIAMGLNEEDNLKARDLAVS